MKKSIVFFAILSIGFLLATSVSAQSVRRIKFKRGAISAVVTGSLTGYSGKSVFVIKVRAGQKLATEQVGNNPITVEIVTPDGSPYDADMDLSCHNRHEISPTIAGDYRITVTECRKADPWKGRFRLQTRVT